MNQVNNFTKGFIKENPIKTVIHYTKQSPQSMNITNKIHLKKYEIMVVINCNNIPIAGGIDFSNSAGPIIT